MEAEFYNIYVEKLLTELSELTKTKVLLAAQVSWADKQLKENNELKNKIENANNDLVGKQKEHDEKVSGLENQLSSLRSEHEALLQEISSAHQTIRSLNEEIEKAANEILDLQEKVNAKSTKKVKVKKVEPEVVQESTQE